MKFVLPLLLSLTSDVLAQPRPASGSLTNPPGCPVITCVMFCTDGLQKDEKGCDKCSCVRNGGKLATGTTSCKRDADGCCSELGYKMCPDQGICVSTSPNAVIPCKSWGNNPPATGVIATPQVFGSGAVPAAPVTKPALATVRPLPAAQTIPLTLTGANFQQTSLPPVSSSLSTGVVSGVAAAGPSGCSDVMCAMYCPNGYQKDSRGCNKCACASLTAGGVCAPVDCGGSSCPGGFSKDSQGCPTCICLTGSVPVLKETLPKIDPSVPIAKPAVLPAVLPAAPAGSTRSASASVDPCKPNPCLASQRCVPDPKQCVRAPCPQYQCISSGGKRGGKKGKQGPFKL